MTKIESDIEIQELVFIASLFQDSTQVAQYGSLLNENKIFKSPKTASIWNKIWETFKEYKCMPLAEKGFDNVFTDEESESINLAWEILFEEKIRAQFLLKKFEGSLDFLLMRQLHSRVDKLISKPQPTTPEGEREFHKSVDNIVTDLSRVRSGVLHSSTMSQSSGELLGQWFDDGLETQTDLLPIPLKGIEKYIDGVPIASANVIVAGFGVGKTSLLCSMAAEWLKYQDVIYVTLEMPGPAILFKVLANVSDGIIDMNSFHKRKDQLEKAELDTLKAYRHGFYKDKDHRLYIIDLPANSLRPAQLMFHIDQIRAKNRTNASAVIIDYAALMLTDNGDNRSTLGWQYVGQIITELSGLAKKHGLTIWTAAQAGGEEAFAQSASGNSKDMPKIGVMRGTELYGSKEVFHNASTAFGLKITRSAECPWVGVGTLSTLKNRFGWSFNNYLIRADYSLAKFDVRTVLLMSDKADISEATRKDLNTFTIEAKKSGAKRGLKAVTPNSGNTSRLTKKADPRKNQTEGHDEMEYGG